jgi:hypothetical protein
MSYILPIQYDVYTQYANRTLPVKNHVTQILPTAAIQLSNQETKQNRQRFADVLEKKLRTMKSTASPTGKGEHVNVFI